MNWIIGLALLALIGVVTNRLFGSSQNTSFSGSGRVIDGDTIEVSAHRIRLFGMDAPEMGQSQGSVAKKALTDMVRGRTLTVHPKSVDQYNRLVARVTREDGKDLSQMMVVNGLALASTRYTKKYARAERAARSTGAGFWALGGVQDGADHRRATQ